MIQRSRLITAVHSFLDKWFSTLWLGQHDYEQWKKSNASGQGIPPDAGFASTSMIAFGVVLLLSTLTLILVTGNCSMDLTGFFIVLIGWNLSDGNRSAARWGSGCMGFVLCMTLLLLVFIALGRAKVNQVAMTPRDAIWAIPVVFVIAAWSATNLRMCLRILRYHRRRKDGQCGACGYPLGIGDVCTECGRAVTPRPLIE